MQGNRLWLAALSGLAIFSLTTQTFAVSSNPYGWYAEANVGSTKLSNKNYPGSSSASGVGGNLNIGYKFMPFFATEIGYTQYANASVKDQFGTKAATVKNYSYDIAAKGIIPIQDYGLEPFAKVGIQRLNSHVSLNNQTAASNLGLSSSSHSATGLYLGVGAQYYFTPEFAAVAEWARAEGNNTTGNYDLYSLGLSFLVD